MDSIERRLRKLEDMVSGKHSKIRWRTIHGKKCEAYPSELFNPEEELKQGILDADLNTCNTPGSLLGFVQMFLASEKDYEEADIETAKLLADLGVEFHLSEDDEDE